MHWIYLSPHLDDIAYSCGGLVWQQTQAGNTVEIWTICAGDPPEGALSTLADEHHARWGVGPEAVAIRREEDKQACQILGAVPRHFQVPDAIYRLHPGRENGIYQSFNAVFGSLHPGEQNLVEEISQDLTSILPENAAIVAPLTLGGHVDHRLTLAVAKKSMKPLLYYADFPYVKDHPDQLSALVPAEAEVQVYKISQPAMRCWGDAVAAHASQLSTFWSGEADMRIDLQTYVDSQRGLRLWKTH